MKFGKYIFYGCVMHTHFSKDAVAPRRTAMVKLALEAVSRLKPDHLKFVNESLIF